MTGWEVWTRAGSKDSCTCPCTYATVTYEKVGTLTLKPIFFFPSPPNLYASWIFVGP